MIFSDGTETRIKRKQICFVDRSPRGKCFHFISHLRFLLSSTTREKSAQRTFLSRFSGCVGDENDFLEISFRVSQFSSIIFVRKVAAIELDKSGKKSFRVGKMLPKVAVLIGNEAFGV